MCLGRVGEGQAEPSSWAAPATSPNKGVQAAGLYESSECSVQKWDSVFSEISGYPTRWSCGGVCSQPLPAGLGGAGGLARGASPGSVGKGLSLRGLVTCDNPPVLPAFPWPLAGLRSAARVSHQPQRRSACEDGPRESTRCVDEPTQASGLTCLLNIKV